jgi:hypothetical protein
MPNPRCCFRARASARRSDVRSYELDEQQRCRDASEHAQAEAFRLRRRSTTTRARLRAADCPLTRYARRRGSSWPSGQGGNSEGSSRWGAGGRRPQEYQVSESPGRINTASAWRRPQAMASWAETPSGPCVHCCPSSDSQCADQQPGHMPGSSSKSSPTNTTPGFTAPRLIGSVRTSRSHATRDAALLSLALPLSPESTSSRGRLEGETRSGAALPQRAQLGDKQHRRSASAARALSASRRRGEPRPE